MRQLRLASSGCNVYPLRAKHCTCSNDDVLIFASTLVCYVYSAHSYQLDKLLSDHENNKTITSTCLSHFDGNLLAVAYIDAKVSLWNIRDEVITRRLSYKQGVLLTLTWSRNDANACIMAACEPGTIKILVWDVTQSTNVTELLSIKIKPDVKVAAVGWSSQCSGSGAAPTLAIGCNNGLIFLYKPADKTQKILMVKDRVAAVSDIQWDRLSPTYLLVAYASFISLWDAETGAEIHIFDKQSGGGIITSIAWIDWQPGNFVSTNSKTGVLKVWNVSQRTSLRAIKIAYEGGLLAAKVGVISKTVMCACTTGSIHVYSLQNMMEELKTTPGHTETIFDCKFSPATADIFASASYDGTLKMWNSGDLSLIRTLHGACDIIYCCDWSPDGRYILGGCGLGKIMLWNAETGQELGFFQHHTKACYCLSWNKCHLNAVCSTSGDGCCVVFELDVDAIEEKSSSSIAMGSKSRRLPGQAYLTRNPNAASTDKPLSATICMKYVGKCPMFGVAWCPNIFNLLCTGAQDGVVRIFDYTRQEPLRRLLTGHSTRAFHCLWSPLLTGVLATGGDDAKVIVWQIDLEELQTEDVICGSKKVLAPKTVPPARELLGHTSNVRALSWSYEHKQLLLSGAWDSTIRLWCISSSSCLRVIRDHIADVYSISSHPSRPFMYVSCSRDSTIRQWELEGVFSLLRCQAVMDLGFGRVVEDGHESCAGIPPVGDGKTLMHCLSGRKSLALKASLAAKSSGDPTELVLRFYQIFNFFSGSNGCLDLFECALALLFSQSNEAPPDAGMFLRPSYFRLVESDVLAAALSDARKLESKKMAVSGQVQSQKLCDEMRQAALAYARAGDIKKYCTLSAEIGDWTKALAAAPGVSMDFWRSLSSKFADQMIEQGSEDCVPILVSLDAEERAAQFYLSRKHNRHAMIIALVKKGKSQGSVCDSSGNSSLKPFSADYGGEIARGDADEIKGVESVAVLLRTVVDATALSLIKQSTSVLAAAQYVSSGLVNEAIQVLQASGELDLAYALSLCFGRPTDNMLAEMAESVAKEGGIGVGMGFELLGRMSNKQSRDAELAIFVRRYEAHLGAFSGPVLDAKPVLTAITDSLDTLSTLVLQSENMNCKKT